MKALISIVLILIALWIAKNLYLTYQNVEKQKESTEQGPSTPSAPPAPSSNLPGLPPALEPSLATAESRGATGLRDWLARYRDQARDPRLASIELDYVVLISHQDPTEARRIFEDVKGRTPTFSPIYDRVKKLERTFQ
jgi:hypothetical protein